MENSVSQKITKIIITGRNQNRVTAGFKYWEENWNKGAELIG